MGKRGPKRQPTSLKLVRGTHRPDRDGDPSSEPQPQLVDGETTPPQWLDEIAVQKWAELVPELQRLNLLTVVDVTALASYCWCYSEFRRAADWIAKNGSVMEVGKDGYRQQVPQVGIAHKALDSMRRYEQSFGLTPSARSGLVVERPKSGGVPRRKRA